MDSKVSDLTPATIVLATDVIPLASVGSTISYKLSIGVLTLNMPNFGNKGITKNVITSASSIAIPLVGTIITLPETLVPYTLANGTAGQELVLISLGTNIVNIASGSVPSLNLVLDSVVTLIFIGTKWVIKSSV